MFWKKKKIQFNGGVLPDLRSEEEKSKDYKQSEIVASVSQPMWANKSQYKNYPKRMQNGSGSCVMQGVEKERGIIAYDKYKEFITFSATPGYQARQNPNVSGSTYVDCIVSTNNGSLPEFFLPSQSMTDEQMMTLPDVPVTR